MPLLSIEIVPGTKLNSLCIVTHSVLTATPEADTVPSHDALQKAEAERG